MCEQCCALTDTYLSPLPGWWLVRASDDGMMMKKNDWGLVRHDDPDFIWSITPWPDPGDEAGELSDKWWDECGEFMRSLTSAPREGWLLVEACIKAGYDPEEPGCVEFWLFDHLGKWIRDHEPFLHNDDLLHYAKNMVKHGYLEEQTREYNIGKFYSLKRPHEAFHEEYFPATTENAEGEDTYSGDLTNESKVMLVSIDNEGVASVLFNKKKYKIHSSFLADELTGE